jgi:hypothetical protein
LIKIFLIIIFVSVVYILFLAWIILNLNY